MDVDFSLISLLSSAVPVPENGVPLALTHSRVKPLNSMTEVGWGGMGGMVVVGMAIMDLVMTKAILEVAEATMISAITTINLQILDP